MRRILVVCAIIVMAAVLGCGPKTNFGPEDVVTIHGVYHNQDGTVLSQKEVGVWLLSVSGFSPMNYWFPDPDSKDITDTTGAYEFEYKGKELMWGGGYAKYIFVSNLESATGAAVAAGFYPTEKDNPLPTLVLWNGDPGATVTSDTAHFDWRSIAETHGVAPDRYVVKASALAWFDLWVEDSVGTDVTCTVPTYVFQNLCTGWRVEALFPRAGDKDTDYVYSSVVDRTVLIAGAPALLSKNVPCYAETKGDTAFAKMTNQIWHEVGGDEKFGNSKPGYLYLDLGASKKVKAVVVYGLSSSFPQQAVHGGFEVFVSDDKTNWGTAVASTPKEAGYFYLPIADKTGRYVKIGRKATSNLQINWLKEIAVFGE